MWVLNGCAEFRAGERGAEILSWPELVSAGTATLHVLRDPDADVSALCAAYAAVAHTSRRLGGSATVADRLADVWQHLSSGKDQ